MYKLWIPFKSNTFMNINKRSPSVCPSFHMFLKNLIFEERKIKSAEIKPLIYLFYTKYIYNLHFRFIFIIF